MVTAVKIKIEPSYMKWLKGYEPTERDTELVSKGTYFICEYNPLTFSGKWDSKEYTVVYQTIDMRDAVGRLTCLDFDDGYIYVQPLSTRKDFFKDPESLIAKPRLIKCKKKNETEWKLKLLVAFDIRKIETGGDENASDELRTRTDTGDELLP